MAEPDAAVADCKANPSPIQPLNLDRVSPRRKEVLRGKVLEVLVQRFPPRKEGCQLRLVRMVAAIARLLP